MWGVHSLLWDTVYVYVFSSCASKYFVMYKDLVFVLIQVKLNENEKYRFGKVLQIFQLTFITW